MVCGAAETFFFLFIGHGKGVLDICERHGYVESMVSQMKAYYWYWISSKFFQELNQAMGLRSRCDA